MATKASLKRPAKAPAPAADGRIDVENLNVPGHKVRAAAGMHRAMRQALLKATPGKAPGLTQSAMRAVVVPHLPADLFPGGAKAAWRAKAVQLDLEAKQFLVRESTKLLRWHQTTRH